ncbi:MAG TPA: ATP-binding cassette domain-containing protein, partial [Candidatus Angelobacter sp.]
MKNQRNLLIINLFSRMQNSFDLLVAFLKSLVVLSVPGPYAERNCIWVWIRVSTKHSFIGGQNICNPARYVIMLHKAPPTTHRERTQTLTSGDLGLPKPEPLLRVSALSVVYNAAGGNVVHALCRLDLEIAGGESLGVLGESGSGKSSLALALMRLLPKNACTVSGSIDYRGRNLAEFSPTELRAMRG